MSPDFTAPGPQEQYDALEDEQERMETDDGEQEELSEHEQRCIAGINRLQGALQRLNRMTEIEKDMRSDHWQQLEKSNADAVQKVLTYLSTISENSVAEQTDSLLSLIAKAEKGIDVSLEGEALGGKEQYRASLQEMFVAWKLDDAENLAQEAVDNAYNTAEVLHQAQHIEERLALYNALPKKIFDRITGEKVVPIPHLMLIAVQLATRDISKLPNKFFISEEFEQKVHQEHERLLDQSRHLQKRLQKVLGRKLIAIKELAAKAKEGDEDEDGAVAIEKKKEKYRALQGEERKIGSELSQIQGMALLIDSALTGYEAGVQRDLGNEEVADRMMIKIWERHGEALKQPILTNRNYTVEVGGHTLILKTECHADGTEEVIKWSQDSQYGVDSPRWESIDAQNSEWMKELTPDARRFLADLHKGNKDVEKIQWQYGWKKTYEEYNAVDIKDAELKEVIDAAYNRLLQQGKITETEKLLYEQQYHAALTLAVEQQKYVSPEARKSKASDLLDQLLVREPLGISIKNRDRLFKDEKVYDATIKTFDERELSATLSEDAKEFIENMRNEGKVPILLCGGVMRAENGIGPSDGSGIVRVEHLAAMNDVGELTDVKGNTIDIALFDDAMQESVRWQTTRSAAFKMKKIPAGVRLMEQGGMKNILDERRIGSIEGQSGEYYEAVDITDVHWFLNKEPPPGMTLLLRHPLPGTPLKKENHHQGVWMLTGPLCHVTEKDFAYGKIEEGEIVLYDISAASKKDITQPGQLTTYYVKKDDMRVQEYDRISIREAEKSREEKTALVERVLDCDTNIAHTKSVGATVVQSMENMQTLYMEGMQSEFRQQNFVDFCRGEAGPLLAMLNSEKTARSFRGTLTQLYKLRETRMGVAAAGGDAVLEGQIKALESIVGIIDKNGKGGLKFMLREMLSAEKFDPQTWGKWFRDDFPAMFLAISTAVAATVITVVTLGSGLILVSAAGAAGGLIGAEAGKDISKGFRDWSDADEVDDGGSMLCQYLDGVYKYNSTTGQYENRTLEGDVIDPLAIQFGYSFATQLGTMFGGQILGKAFFVAFTKCARIQSFVPGAGEVQKMATEIMKKLAVTKEAIAAIGNKLERNAATRFLKELFEEFTEEAAIEPSIQSFLNQINEDVGKANTLLLSAGTTFAKLFFGRTGRVHFTHGVPTYDNILDTIDDATMQGYTVDNNNGVLDITMRGTHIMTIYSEADASVMTSKERSGDGGELETDSTKVDVGEEISNDELGMQNGDDLKTLGVRSEHLPPVRDLTTIEQRITAGEMTDSEVLALLENKELVEGTLFPELNNTNNTRQKIEALSEDAGGIKAKEGETDDQLLERYLGMEEGVLTIEDKQNFLTAHLMQLSAEERTSIANDPDSVKVERQLLNKKKALFLRRADYSQEIVNKLMGDTSVDTKGKREGIGLCGKCSDDGDDVHFIPDDESLEIGDQQSHQIINSYLSVTEDLTGVKTESMPAALKDLLPSVMEKGRVCVFAHVQPGNGIDSMGYTPLTKDYVIRRSGETGSRNPLNGQSRLLQEYDHYTNPFTLTESLQLDKRSDGKIRIIYSAISEKFKSSDGRPGCIFQIAIDLSAREGQELYKSLKESSPENIRQFFLTAGQQVHGADYIYSSRVPKYKKFADGDFYFSETTRSNHRQVAIERMSKKGGEWLMQSELPPRYKPDMEVHQAVRKNPAALQSMGFDVDKTNHIASLLRSQNIEGEKLRKMQDDLQKKEDGLFAFFKGGSIKVARGKVEEQRNKLSGISRELRSFFESEKFQNKAAEARNNPEVMRQLHYLSSIIWSELRGTAPVASIMLEADTISYPNSEGDQAEVEEGGAAGKLVSKQLQEGVGNPKVAKHIDKIKEPKSRERPPDLQTYEEMVQSKREAIANLNKRISKKGLDIDIDCNSDHIEQMPAAAPENLEKAIGSLADDQRAALCGRTINLWDRAPDHSSQYKLYINMSLNQEAMTQAMREWIALSKIVDNVKNSKDKFIYNEGRVNELTCTLDGNMPAGCETLHIILAADGTIEKIWMNEGNEAPPPSALIAYAFQRVRSQYEGGNAAKNEQYRETIKSNIEYELNAVKEYSEDLVHIVENEVNTAEGFSYGCKVYYANQNFDAGRIHYATRELSDATKNKTARRESIYVSLDNEGNITHVSQNEGGVGSIPTSPGEEGFSMGKLTEKACAPFMNHPVTAANLEAIYETIEEGLQVIAYNSEEHRAKNKSRTDLEANMDALRSKSLIMPGKRKQRVKQLKEMQQELDGIEKEIAEIEKCNVDVRRYGEPQISDVHDTKPETYEPQLTTPDQDTINITQDTPFTEHNESDGNLRQFTAKINNEGMNIAVTISIQKTEQGKALTINISEDGLESDALTPEEKFQIVQGALRRNPQLNTELLQSIYDTVNTRVKQHAQEMAVLPSEYSDLRTIGNDLRKRHPELAHVRLQFKPPNPDAPFVKGRHEENTITLYTNSETEWQQAIERELQSGWFAPELALMEISAEQLTPDIYRTFILLHEFGHAAARAEYEANQITGDGQPSWSEYQKRDQENLPVPGLSPDALSAMSSEEYYALLDKHAELSNKYTRDQSGKKQLLHDQADAYKKLPNEQDANGHAIRFMHELEILTQQIDAKSETAAQTHQDPAESNDTTQQAAQDSTESEGAKNVKGQEAVVDADDAATAENQPDADGAGWLWRNTIGRFPRLRRAMERNVGIKRDSEALKEMTGDKFEYHRNEKTNEEWLEVRLGEHGAGRPRLALLTGIAESEVSVRINVSQDDNMYVTFNGKKKTGIPKLDTVIDNECNGHSYSPELAERFQAEFLAALNGIKLNPQQLAMINTQTHSQNDVEIVDRNTLRVSLDTNEQTEILTTIRSLILLGTIDYAITVDSEGNIEDIRFGDRSITEIPLLADLVDSDSAEPVIGQTCNQSLVGSIHNAITHELENTQLTAPQNAVVQFMQECVAKDIAEFFPIRLEDGTLAIRSSYDMTTFLIGETGEGNIVIQDIRADWRERSLIPPNVLRSIVGQELSLDNLGQYDKKIMDAEPSGLTRKWRLLRGAVRSIPHAIGTSLEGLGRGVEAEVTRPEVAPETETAQPEQTQTPPSPEADQRRTPVDLPESRHIDITLENAMRGAREIIAKGDTYVRQAIELAKKNPKTVGGIATAITIGIAAILMNSHEEEEPEEEGSGEAAAVTPEAVDDVDEITIESLVEIGVTIELGENCSAKKKAEWDWNIEVSDGSRKECYLVYEESGALQSHYLGVAPGMVTVPDACRNFPCALRIQHKEWSNRGVKMEQDIEGDMGEDMTGKLSGNTLSITKNENQRARLYRIYKDTNNVLKSEYIGNLQDGASSQDIELPNLPDDAKENCPCVLRVQMTEWGDPQVIQK